MSVEELQKKVKELESLVEELRAKGASGGGPSRQKIEQMSAEVVDANPYRFDGVLSLELPFTNNLPFKT